MATGVQVQGEDRGHGLPQLVVTTSSPVSGRDSPVKEVAPPSPSVQPVILKSNLHKKGKRFKGWHQRYFEIQGKHMYYYKNHAKTDCLGEIDLSMCIRCNTTDEATFGAPFEICTTVRTHVLSARSPAEREQWILAIRSQMEAESDKKSSQTKPKRWRTFRNHFKRTTKVQNPASAKVTKRKSIMDRLRLRKTPAPLKLAKESSEEPKLHRRPLSLVDEQVPMDTLEALLDTMPSRSLPATPLAKKRSETVNYCPSISPEPMSLAVPVSVEINTSVDSLDVKNEDTLNVGISEDKSDKEQKEPHVKMNVPSLGYENCHNQESLTFKEEAWDKVREILQVSDETESNVLPDENQEWTEHTTGMEQLRAFLAVCD